MNNNTIAFYNLLITETHIIRRRIKTQNGTGNPGPPMSTRMAVSPVSSQKQRIV